MRIKLSILTLLSFLSIIASAQIKYGVKAGLNVSKIKTTSLYPTSIQEQGFRAGLHIGGFFNYGISEDLSMGTELQYNQMGESFRIVIPTSGSVSDPLPGSRSDVQTFTLHYVSIPVIAKYNFDDFALSGGFQMSYLLKAKSSVTDNSSASGLNKLEYGILIDGEYHISNSIGVSARYYNGISNISKLNIAPERKNRSINLSLKYYLN